MEPLLHAIVMLVVVIGVIVGLAGEDLLARWSTWQRFKAFVREKLRGLSRG